ncbi:MAG TPA: transposase [Lamprocystis sp. (in: g-proteobacteria)]|nr:transposase [Lamprocystis sp. (in: g-proteobacteria)]
MYIRRTLTRTLNSGEHYYSHRLVRSERAGGRVRQVTLLNLGSDFTLPSKEWSVLCTRIEEVLRGQDAPTALGYEPAVERDAQRLAALLLARQAQARSARQGGEGAVEAVDLQSLDLVRVRTVGVEQVALWALGELRLAQTLAALGMSQRQVLATVGMIVGRLAVPGRAEGATRLWWEQRSAIGELLGVDFASLTPLVLYRAGDNLIRHRQAIEQQVFARLHDLLELPTTGLLFDLTQTCGEVDAGAPAKRTPGAITEDSGTWPLVTLGLVVDGSGFVHHSASFAGDGAGAPTLQRMLDGLRAPATALVVMAQGVSSAANLAWLRANGYGYLVVSRGAARYFDPDQTISGPMLGRSLALRRVGSADGREVNLYCDSPERQTKEEALGARRAVVLEGHLRRLAEGLARPGADRCPDRLQKRIACLLARGGPGYRIALGTDPSGQEVTALTWERIADSVGRPSVPGLLCVRGSQTDWDAERMWESYFILTDLAAVFDSLRPSAEWRPFNRPSENCAEAQLFISVLAYQCIQLVRRRLQCQGITASWQSLRQSLSSQCRATVSVRRGDGQTLHLRTASRPEPMQLAIFRALGIDPGPGAVQTVV